MAVKARQLQGHSSAWLECHTVTVEVAGSSPVVPANQRVSQELLRESECFLIKKLTLDSFLLIPYKL